PETTWTASKFDVPRSLFIVPDTGNALGMVAIIVVLMNRADDLGNVDHGGTQLGRAADQPRVPADAANHERRKLRIEAAGKREVIDIVITAENTFGPRELNDSCFPIRDGKIERRGDIRVAAAPDHQKELGPCADFIKRAAKLLRQDDVAIAVAKQVMTGDLLSAAEDRVQALGAAGVDDNVWLVAQAHLGADLGCPGVVSKENDLDGRMKK